MFYSIIGVIEVVIALPAIGKEMPDEVLFEESLRTNSEGYSPIEEIVEKPESTYTKGKFHPVEKLVRAIDKFSEFTDMKMNSEKLERSKEGFYIRRGKCPDTLRDSKQYMAGFVHCHTSYSSDGRLEPEDLVRLAFEKGAKIVAISDHVPRPKNVEEATKLYYGLDESIARAKKEAKKYGIIVIPGVEFNIEPCAYVRVDSEDRESAAGHVGIYLPYDIDLKEFVKLMCKNKGETLDDFVEMADDVHKMGGVVVANHVTSQDGLGEEELRYLIHADAVDGVEDVNLSAGLIMPYNITEAGELVYYSDRLGLASIASQDSHGIPQASVATLFDRKNIERSIEGFDLNSDEYLAAASKEILRQIRDHETEIYFETDDFRFPTSALLEKLRIFHPVIGIKLFMIGFRAKDLFNTFFGRSFFRSRSK
jgi:hypothetical protein